MQKFTNTLTPGPSLSLRRRVLPAPPQAPRRQEGHRSNDPDHPFRRRFTHFLALRYLQATPRCPRRGGGRGRALRDIARLQPLETTGQCRLAGQLPKRSANRPRSWPSTSRCSPSTAPTPRTTTRSIAARPSGAPVPLRLRLGVHRAQGAALHGRAHGGHPQADDGGRDQGIAPPSPQGRDSRPVPGPGSRVLQRGGDSLLAGGADAVPDAGGGPRPQARPPAGPQRLAGLQGDEAERLVRVHPERSSERTATVQVCVKCRNRRGERGKKGRDPWVYAYWGIGPKRFDWVKDTYRSRFGIETSYRQMNQCRIRTTTPRFAVRFLYVAIGFLMRNLWVWLHYAVLSSPHRGGRGLASGGGVRDVRACRDSIVLEHVPVDSCVVAPPLDQQECFHPFEGRSPFYWRRPENQSMSLR